MGLHAYFLNSISFETHYFGDFFLKGLFFPMVQLYPKEDAHKLLPFIVFLVLIRVCHYHNNSSKK